MKKLIVICVLAMLLFPACLSTKDTQRVAVGLAVLDIVTDSSVDDKETK